MATTGPRKSAQKAAAATVQTGFSLYPELDAEQAQYIHFVKTQDADNTILLTVTVPIRQRDLIHQQWVLQQMYPDWFGDVTSIAEDKKKQALVLSKDITAYTTRGPITKYLNKIRPLYAEEGAWPTFSDLVQKIGPRLEKEHKIQLIRKLGAGSFGIVFECKYQNQIMAIKLVQFVSTLVLELYVQQQMFRGNPYLVSSKELVFLDDLNMVGILLEKAEMDFADYLKDVHDGKITSGAEKTCLVIYADILCGLGALHSVDMAHQDMKPENVLLFRDKQTGGLRGKIADFGLSAFYTALGGEKGGGTAGYYDYARDICHPFLKDRKNKSSKDKRQAVLASDIWAMGVFAIDMLTCLYPRTYDEDTKTYMSRILSTVYLTIEELDILSFRFKPKTTKAKQAQLCTIMDADELDAIDAMPDAQDESKQTESMLRKHVSLCLKLNPFLRPTTEQLLSDVLQSVQGLGHGTCHATPQVSRPWFRISDYDNGLQASKSTSRKSKQVGEHVETRPLSKHAQSRIKNLAEAFEDEDVEEELVERHVSHIQQNIDQHAKERKQTLTEKEQDSMLNALLAMNLSFRAPSDLVPSTSNLSKLWPLLAAQQPEVETRPLSAKYARRNRSASRFEKAK